MRSLTNLKQNDIRKIMTLSLLALATCSLMSGCAMLDYLKLDGLKFGQSGAAKVENKANLAQNTRATSWIAPLPHQGSLNALNQFWAQYQDALLSELISAAEKESATLASAKTRIIEARAARQQASAALLPSLDGSFSASRAVQQPAFKYNNLPSGSGSNFGQPSGASNTTKLGLESSWELDLFGKNAAAVDASRANLQGAESSWHEARVSVAAEVASAYFDYRFCLQQLVVVKADAASRSETSRITDIVFKAGFTDAATANLALASAAAGQQQVVQQQTTCDLTMKQLVAITNISETELTQKMLASTNNSERLNNTQNQSLFNMTEIPAQVIAQRPDIYTAEQAVVASAADLQNVEAQRYPKISLNGSIGLMRLSASSYTANGNVWSLGPLSITLPIFDGGVRKANVATGEAKLEEASVNYRSKIRNAVKEVEQALVNLDSAKKRSENAQTASDNYQAALAKMQTKYQAGFANLIELEDSRRTSLNAQTSLIKLSQDRNNAWIALYRAAGGGWTKNDNTQLELANKNH